MKAQYERRLAMLERVNEFGTVHPLTPANARATVLFGQVPTLVGEMRSQGGDQVHGRGTFLAGATERAALAKELRTMLRDIAQTARSLDPLEFPAVGEQFRLPRTPRYQALLDTARGFLEAVTPIKQPFIDRGFAADFDVQLTEKIAAFDAASQRKHNGRIEQRGGTVSLDDSVSRSRVLMRELNAIVTNQLRVSDPTLLEVWRTASRVEQDPQSGEAPPEQPPATPPNP